MSRSEQPRDLFKHGETATARVLRRWDTGVVFNGYPQIGLLLEVHPAGRATFQAEVKTVVDQLHRAELEPGAVVEVIFDPDQPARVALSALPGANAHT